MSTNNSTDSNSASSLKYEKTQNRDIIGTIERINRSQQFVPLSENILDSISSSIYDYAVKEFKQQWRNKSETHDNPPSFRVNASIGSPILKRVPDSNSFYYVMTVSTSFFMDCKPVNGETDVDAETRLRSWFSENISQNFNTNVARKMSETLPDGSEGMFSFPILEKRENVDKAEEGKIGGRKPKYGMINLMYMSDVRSRKSDNMSKDVFPYRDSEGIRSGLVSNMALAVERMKCEND